MIDALGNYTAAQKAEAIEKSQSTLDRLDQRIDALEDKIDSRSLTPSNNFLKLDTRAIAQLTMRERQGVRIKGTPCDLEIILLCISIKSCHYPRQQVYHEYPAMH